MAIGFDITNFADFTKSEGKVILTDLVLGADSFDYCTIQEGIKSSDKVIDVQDGNTVIQSGDYTGAWVGGTSGGNKFSGNTKFVDSTITVKELFVKEGYKKLDIEKAAAQMLMKMGSDPADLPEFYKGLIMKLKGNKIKLLEDYHLWQGELSGATYNQFNGFVNQVKNGSATSAGSAVDLGAVTGTTKAQTIMDHVEKVYQTGVNAHPEWIETADTVRIYMSPKNFDAYFRTVYKAAGYTQDILTLGKINTVKEFAMPGTNVMITKIAGLNGKNNILMGREGNFVIGCDLKSENGEEFTFEWLNESMIYRLFALFKLGAKVVRPTEVIWTV